MRKKSKFDSHVQISVIGCKEFVFTRKCIFFSDKKINSFQHSDTAKNGMFLPIKSEFY